ncbi:MAG TPA: FlgD immunoglobulin-like domain containing protein [Candidatus Krumholzibacteria bacterium]|nr:FlgD immunoglobulin-like domain containing protein [Candidatus Krumholzibacteria bacterium]
MTPRNRPPHSAFFALATGMLLIASTGYSATQPGRPVRTTTPQQTYTPLGETVFTCGTYRGNETQNREMEAMHLNNQQLLRQGLKSRVAAGLDYVYNNVWVIEDDGSLTLSGTNAFDTDNKTFQYANDGGGVFTASQVAYSYDDTLGTLIAPGDDGAILVNLPFSFPFEGQSYNQMYVSGNGIVSFGAVPNPNGFYNDADFYSTTPKIAPYYLDLNETANGDVRVRSGAGKFIVSWISVFEYANPASNTFQLVLYPNGNFTVTYNGIGSTTAANGAPIITGYYPGGVATLEQISLSSGLPHSSAPGAAMYEQYYSHAVPLVDEVALLNRFYTEFPDDFFQVVFFTNFTQDMGSAFAYERNIQNNVTGIGQGTFDSSAQYGSGGALKSLCNMNSLGVWSSADPTARVFGKGNNFLTIMGQESGHRWGAYIMFDKGGGPSDMLLGRALAHWSYYADVDHSSLEGGDWVNTGGSSYTCPTNIDYYSELDEYLFGLRKPEEVKATYYISSPTNDPLSARSVGTPLLGSTCNGAYVGVSMNDIINAEGPRTPTEANETHDFRQAFIFLIAAGTTPSQAELDKIAGFRAAWEEYFEKSCDGRASLNTSLAGPYQVGSITGEVRDKLSQQIVPNFTALSAERSFSQHVPAGGRFTFRYDDGPTRGTGEPVTLIFTAPGYLPDTLATSINYGENKSLYGLLDGIWLTPITTAAGGLPVPTELRPNHPNPFNPSTTIEYSLANAGHVRITVFDAAGSRVRTLVDRMESKGEHRVEFNGRDDHGQPLASGVYFYRLDTGLVAQTRKMVLLK